MGGQFWVVIFTLNGSILGYQNYPIIVTAILERLLHHSAVINIKGNSYRLKGKMERKNESNLKIESGVAQF